MELNKKNIIVGIFLIVGGYYIYRYYSSKKKSVVTKNELVGVSTPTSIFPIKKGSVGTKVVEIQKFLLGIDKSSLPKFGADGKFGSETEDALNKYLGKKSIDSQEDFDKLKQIRDEKLFPFVIKRDRKDDFRIGNFPIFSK